MTKVGKRVASVRRSSWIDRMIDAISALPGPPWVAYLAAAIVLEVASHAVGWIDGGVPFGRPDAYRASLPIYVVGPIAVIHYLDSVARTALDRFRPALGVEDEVTVEFERGMTAMPIGPTNALTIIGALAWLAFVATGSIGSSPSSAPFTFPFDVVAALFAFVQVPVFVYHTLRQLRQISRIHERAKDLDLYRPDPLYAFSSLSAQTGGAILAMNYLSVATNPSTVTNPTVLITVLMTFLLAIGCFVVPLLGIHHRIEAEKARLETDAGSVLRLAIDELDRRVRAGDFAGATEMTHVLEGLVIKRDSISRISTWPWRVGTLRAFVSAVLLPVALWLVFRALEALVP